MRVKKYLALSLIVTTALTFVACGNKEKPTNATNNDTAKITETKDTKKDEINEKLKNATTEGTLTDEEKAKIVELTEEVSKLGLDVDYAKDTLEAGKEFFKYTTPEVARDFPDDTLNKILNNQKATKQIIKTEAVTFNKVTKGADGNITVDFTAKEHVINHTDEKLNGKTFNAVECRFVFDKEWKICAFAFGDLK